MTSQNRERYTLFLKLLQSDPIAKVAREAGNHDTRLQMLQQLGLTVEIRKPGDVNFGGKQPLSVLTEVRITDSTGRFPAPDGHVSGDLKTAPTILAYGASGDEVDALEHALFGYARELVAAKAA